MSILNIALGAALMIMLGPVPGFIIWIVIDIIYIGISKYFKTDKSSNQEEKEDKFKLNKYVKSSNFLIKSELKYPFFITLSILLVELFYRYVLNTNLTSTIGQINETIYIKREVIATIGAILAVWFLYFLKAFDKLVSKSNSLKLSLSVFFILFNILFYLIGHNIETKIKIDYGYRKVAYSTLYECYATQFMIISILYLLLLGLLLTFSKRFNSTIDNVFSNDAENT